MYPLERQGLIERVLEEGGRVAVVDLAERFAVTTETVRRDLRVLEQAGILRRVHGGAVATERIGTAEVPVAERSGLRAATKQLIAARALDVLAADFHGSLYFDAGTTTAAVARLLPERLAAVRGVAEVVTHSLTLAPALACAARVSLTVVGGRIRGVTAAAVGAGTVRAIQSLRTDIVFVGANGLSAGFGMSTPDPEEAAVKEAIVRAALRVVLVADASKFCQECLVSFAPLDAIDVLVTDREPEGALADALAAAGAEVWSP
ncbi:D-beta-D-heptose 1-phosphate adenosyltransferase [Leifsonia xyli subsp. xyli]|uniref:Lactose phosphotransferase system repressor n=2 Tax=Leifsonia xyli subsp. xyli TaxID=59736 RepID=Q6AG93_LEIXX|nr:DeoR/GlpR family DNA-binding transcription regulator [Leifsonia xyli]AAT88602.1 transcriptional regulator, DeoR family [Leifsonia xyli subsp. xyli str. CTCB07]ODA90549.1 D-beta-D-heptose 1-phosphate adenosyltransferase [Leifsonia xyli subsp. xyli]